MDLDNIVPVPDYANDPDGRPTLIIGVSADENVMFGVEAVGFDLPANLRIVKRDYDHGPIHEDNLAYEDEIVE
jgi:hypothetical protein